MANHLDVVDQMNEIDRLRAELVAKADEYVRNMAIAIDTRDSEIERLCAELEVTKLERDTALTDRHDTIQDLRAELARSLEENKRVRKDYEIVTVELAAKDARIAELENKNSYNLQIVREATARIAELEAAGNRLGDAAITGILDGNDALARAELAAWKAQGDTKRAEAERDALREALQKIEQETIDHVAVRIARAARDHSLAGENS